MNIAEESPVSQPGKKLEKSLDAIAALRRAMEERLAEAKATQERADIAAKASYAVAEAEAAQDKADAEVKAAKAKAETETETAHDIAQAHTDAVQKLATINARILREKAAIEAEEARKKAEIDAEEARKKAEVEAEEEQKKASLEAEEAARIAALEAEEARNKAEAEAEEAARIAAIETEEARKKAEIETEEARKKAEADAREAKEKAEADALRAQEKAEAEAQIAQVKAEAEALAAEEKAEAEAKAAQVKAEAEAKAAQEQAEAKLKLDPKNNAKEEEEPHPELHIDLVEWTQIMMRVSEAGQRMVRDYIVRTRDKPVDTLPFTPIPMMDSMSRLMTRLVEDPEAYTDAQLATWQNYIDLTRATMMRMTGLKTASDTPEAPKDKRFKAKDWQTNWMFDFIKQAYLSTTDEARRLVQQEASNVEDKIAKKLEFYSRLFMDATAPNNFWLTNPEVLRTTIETKGENLIKGLENFLRDVESGNGLLRIRMSDYRAFELGKNIATTPGKVVYQNDLMQLIQYAPSTPSVHKVPFLVIPPWINKYYILDLREKNSFIRYLVSQGHTVFCISWVNPDRRMALTQFEDYMDKGVLTALKEIKDRTGEDEVNALGYCIGGTLLACTQAYMKAKPEKAAPLPKFKSATYFVTMIDFSQPGDLGVFIDEDQIRLLEDRMTRLGYMDANSLITTFNVLRSNDLIWPFVINNYLLGREPFPFDILYWNTDSTNLPAAMQSYYLRMMYLHNKLIEPNALTMREAPLDLTQIDTPSFLISTREDHIAPWRSTYAATKVYKGPMTFVLAGSGHIAGVINPPAANKYGYWTNDELPENPDEWLEKATPHKGSWWPAWIEWLKPYAGEDVLPREVEDGIEDAPGSYVKVRVV